MHEANGSTNFIFETKWPRFKIGINFRSLKSVISGNKKGLGSPQYLVSFYIINDASQTRDLMLFLLLIDICSQAV